MREPDKALSLIMEIFEKIRRETESKKAEYLRQIDEIRKYFVSKINEEVKAESDRLKKVIEAKVSEIEKLTKDITDMRKQNSKLFEENNKLEVKNNELELKNIELQTKCDDLAAENVRLVDAAARIKEERNDAAQENEDLKIITSHLQEQLDLRKRDVFGASTENTYRILNDSREIEDPLSEDAKPEPIPKSRSAKNAIDLIDNKINKKTPEKGRKPREKGDTEKRYANLTHIDYCPYTDEALDKEFGVGNWRPIFKLKKQKLCETRPVVYVRNEYSLVIEYFDFESGERMLKYLPCNPHDKSQASSSIMASISTKIYDLGLPYNRIERYYKARGVEIDKQLMNSWIIRFTTSKDALNDELAPIGLRVWKKLKQEQLKYPVLQIDETTWPVVLWEDKKNGSKAYIWVYVTSELIKGHKIIWYEFTDTRSADGLRRYLRNLAKYIVSDAYGAYSALAKETANKNAFCWMHMRRKFAEAVFVKELDKMTREEMLADPTVKGLLISNNIFRYDTPLKKLSASERKARRLEEVKPYVDEFFEFVHSFNIEKIGGKLKEAVVYALHQEEGLKVFLEDGNIPIDNGECERRIKPLVILRKNAMFSYSMAGANANAVMFTLVETAKANGAEPYMYIKFLYEAMGTVKKDDKLDDLMLWSARFKDFASRNAHSDDQIPASCKIPSGKLKLKGKIA